MKIRSMTSRLFLTMLILAFAAVVGWAQPVAANPVVIDGNPACADLGFDFGFKPQPEPPPGGSYTLPDGLNTLSLTSDGTYFDWQSTLGIDAVIVKGGSNANVYTYDPEAFSGSGLSSPINDNNGAPFAISHIEVCYDYEVDVAKSAETSFTRTWDWSIEKSAQPEEWWLFNSETAHSSYTVAVTRSGHTDSDWTVAGTISVDNNTPSAATIESVADVLSPGLPLAVDCGVGFPFELAAGAALECSYQSPLADGSDRLNTAQVTTSGIVGGGTAEADVDFGEPTLEVNAAVNVADSNGSIWTFNDSGAVTYDQSYYCRANKGLNTNVATIVETGQQATAGVFLHCYVLTMQMNAETSYVRDWTWNLDKSADQTDLLLAAGQEFLVNYTLNLDATPVDSGFRVSGEVLLENPNPVRDANFVWVRNLITPPGTWNVVTCPSLVVPAGGSLSCHYSFDLADATGGTIQTAARQQNYIFQSDGSSAPRGRRDYNAHASFAFGAPSDEVDECIDLNDSNLAPSFIDVICADALPLVLDYALPVGPYQDCGQHEVPNQAWFMTHDNQLEGDDTWTVNVDVPCDSGCTLTPGYWKTHSALGPAPYDDTWALLAPQEHDVPFFLSAQSYYDVLWTPPKKGNAYYILAHAYIAAELNFLNGASSTGEVDEAFAAATEFFSQHTPDEVERWKGRDRALPLGWAYILDEYNNGLIGPGHCSE